MRILYALALTSLLIFSTLLHAQAPAIQSGSNTPTLAEKLSEVRFDLRIENGKYAGSAAPVLQGAVDAAQYVLIGEDHLTREIPQFASTMCDEMSRRGLSAMAVEAGPQAAKFVSSFLSSPDRLQQMAALQRQYPDSVAFLNIRQENDLIKHCSEVARPDFHLWGLDQEFTGSSGWLLDLVLATHPGSATKAITQLKDEEQSDAAKAKGTGDPSQLFLLSAPDRELNDTAAMLQREANPRATELFQELVKSHDIYLKNAQGSADSNAMRARLLKQNLRADVSATHNPQYQRVLFKFGDWHLYKGFNPLHQLDLGNYIAEMADGQGTTSLHICVLGAMGTHRMYAGYAKPMSLQKFVMDEDPDYRWLKPAIDNQLPNAWTLYDLRKLRFQKIAQLDPDMERLIYGYDLLVIIPELTPADPIE